MQDVILWYEALPAPFKIAVWVLAFVFVLSILKRLLKLAILVTILIILIFVLRALTLHLN